MDMSLSKLRELVMYREAWRAAAHGAAKCRTWLSDWTTILETLINEFSKIKTINDFMKDFPGGMMDNNPPANAGYMG